MNKRKKKNISYQPNFFVTSVSNFIIGASIFIYKYISLSATQSVSLIVLAKTIYCVKQSAVHTEQF